jgi:hypothetical protein
MIALDLDRRLPWRGMLATVVLAALAAFAGARLGSTRVEQKTAPLAERIFDLIGDEPALTSAQRDAIRAVGTRYAPVREELRVKSRVLNARLLGLMADEQRFGPKTEATLAELQAVMGERLKLSMEYMLEVRQELAPEQRIRFDRQLSEEALVSR